MNFLLLTFKEIEFIFILYPIKSMEVCAMKSKMWAYHVGLTSEQPRDFDVNDGGKCLKRTLKNFDKAVWDDTLDIMVKTSFISFSS